MHNLQGQFVSRNDFILIWKIEQSLFPLIQLELSSNYWPKITNRILTFKDSTDTWNCQFWFRAKIVIVIISYKKFAKVSSWETIYIFIHFDSQWLNILMIYWKIFIFIQQFFKWCNGIITIVSTLEPFDAVYLSYH